MGVWTATPRTWVAGEVPTAANFNSDVRDFGRAFADAWTSYTPTLTASTTNPTNWTQTGYYMRAGKLVHVKGTLSAGGSMTAGSGTYRVALPVNANTTITDAIAEGSVYMIDNSTANGFTNALACIVNAAYVQIIHGAATPAYVSNTVPWTWAAGDYIKFAFSYEAA